ncbi:MAG: M14 family metallocarboxypeptidase [Verrucomicrobia bacterium]|nr:M14 family metallocarboxypeptidase [Verrucomicrobiota bacterium]
MKNRLGRNEGGYCGERIDIQAVLSEIDELARQLDWQPQKICSDDDLIINAYVRPSSPSSHCFYISSGIHGDEPAGPLAVLEMGCALGTRNNGQGIDLNRHYRQPVVRETISHIHWLQSCPRFDCSVLLHEDWEANGYYLYELNGVDGTSVSRQIIEAVGQLCPIHADGPVDDWQSCDGVIRPSIDPIERPEWPEALFLLEQKTRRNYTLEAPSDFDLPLRVASHISALRTVLLNSPS